jgi:hypothetical protein
MMNQASPRIFEMAASCTVMILFEGSYSGIVQPHVHYLPLKKDFSNLSEITSLLNDDSFIDNMVIRAKNDIIDSGKYSYSSFIHLVDQELYKLFNASIGQLQAVHISPNSAITDHPIRSEPPILSGNSSWLIRRIAIILYQIKEYLPLSTRAFIKKLIGRA